LVNNNQDLSEAELNAQACVEVTAITGNNTSSTTETTPATVTVTKQDTSTPTRISPEEKDEALATPGGNGSVLLTIEETPALATPLIANIAAGTAVAAGAALVACLCIGAYEAEVEPSLVAARESGDADARGAEAPVEPLSSPLSGSGAEPSLIGKTSEVFPREASRLGEAEAAVEPLSAAAREAAGERGAEAAPLLPPPAGEPTAASSILEVASEGVALEVASSVPVGPITQYGFEETVQEDLFRYKPRNRMQSRVAKNQ
jgi:hypothetical protein